MSARISSGGGDPLIVDFEINRKVSDGEDFNTHNSVGEDGSVKALEHGHPERLIKIKAIHITDAKKTSLKNFVSLYQAGTFSFWEVYDTTDELTVRFWGRGITWVRNWHNNHTALITLREEAS